VTYSSVNLGGKGLNKMRDIIAPLMKIATI